MGKLATIPNTTGYGKAVQMDFGGYAHVAWCGDGGIYDMENMSSDHAPLLTPRAKRRSLSGYSPAQFRGGICLDDTLVYCSGTTLWLEGRSVATVTATEKMMTAMGNRVFVFPDKIYLNISAKGYYATMAALEAAVTDPDYGDMYSVAGDLYGWDGADWTFVEKECDSLESQIITAATFEATGTLYDSPAEWNTIYAAGVNWADYFRVGDAVTISGCGNQPANNVTSIIREIDGERLRFYEYVFRGLTEGSTESVTEAGVLLHRTIPDFDFVCAGNNRLWGCKGDTVFGSKLGDPFNFNVFDGLSTDSYSVETGTPGDFTACCFYLGYPHFFKEERIFKLYGAKPADFQAVASMTLGVMKGSAKSLAIAGETLFYLTRNGVAAYTGGAPSLISDAFGDMRFKDGVGGSDLQKYYISMEERSGGHHLFVFDPVQSVWHREDATAAAGFWMKSGILCMAADSKFQAITAGMAGSEESSVPWMVEFGDMVFGSPNKKGIGKVQMRLDFIESGTVTVWLQYDSSGTWEKAAEIQGSKKFSRVVPLIPRRCDHFRLKLTGTAETDIHALTVWTYKGSEI